MYFLSHYAFSSRFWLGSVADLHHDVRRAALIAISAAHGRRPDALLRGPSFTYASLTTSSSTSTSFDAILGVGDGRIQHLQHHRRHALVGLAQNDARFVGRPAADQVHYQPRLLRRRSNVSGFCSGLHAILFTMASAGLRGLLRAAGAAAAFTECPLNWRVGENSPSLWPTMFSVTYTGMNFLPLWTASVCPTNSGTNGRAARPRPHHFLFVLFVHVGHLLRQMVVGERAFLE